MGMRSMTGFGQGSRESATIRVAVELRGVNNRYADLRLRLPAELSDREPELRRRILRHVKRGRIEANVRVEPLDGSEPRQSLNRPLLDEVVRSAREIADEFDLDGSLDLTGVLGVPGMFRPESIELSWTDETATLVQGALEAALRTFDADRAREGDVLGKEIAARIDAMLERAGEARARAGVLPSLLRDKLVQRLEALSGAVELDAARVAQEAAYLADRADVTEELVRLEAHLGQARSLIGDPGDEPQGKRLEFLFQEIHREANTVCSKSADLELTDHALAIKLDVEKAREQVLNLE